jgi:transposase InsO family protein
MAAMGLAGAVRGKPVKTTVSSPATPCPEERVSRQFHAPRPNALRLSDFSYVATWAGFVYVAFGAALGPMALAPHSSTPSLAGSLVGGSPAPHGVRGRAGFVLDALEQPLHARRPAQNDGLAHHSDRGSQCASIKCTERLAEAGVEPSVGSVGDSCDNALAETAIGLFKTEVIRRRGPWKGLEAVEFATLEWVDWFNNRRLLEPIGDIPPAEAEDRFHAENQGPALVA